MTPANLPNDFGSARGLDDRPTNYELRHLDVHVLNRSGLFQPDSREEWSEYRWTSGQIRVRYVEGLVFVAYKVRAPGANDWEQEIAEGIQVEWTPCQYGGQRPWFLCPECSRRCGKLYGGRLFRCRLCVNLVYESTRQPEWERLLDRAQDIRVRLGGSASTAAPFPPKPKHMRWRTYWKLREESVEAALRALRIGLASCR